MIIALIVACEVAFWVAVVAGLVLRYPLRRPKAGLVVLALVPVIDLILLIAVAVDLRRGATATFAHALAAFYLGFSVAYGHRMIAWADVRFAHRFAGGPAPTKPYGAAYTRLCWGDVARTTLAAGIASLVTWLLTTWVGAPQRTDALDVVYRWSAILIGLELFWAIGYWLWPRKPPKGAVA